jgi:hypothetical protein
MANPVKTDLMIARLEAANARAYEQARWDKTASKSEQAAVHSESDERPLYKRPSSRAMLFILAIIGLVLAASFYVAVFGWTSSYGEAARLTFARWAQASGLESAAPRAAEQQSDPPQPSIGPEIEQRLQKMADELRELKQGLEQLKTGQDLSRRSDTEIAEKLTTNTDQMARDNANVVEQLNAIQTQSAHDNAAVAELLKATQDQLSDLAWSRPAKLVRKPARRRPVSIVPRVQKLAQAQIRPR